jgi:hypothetical protein
MPADPIRPPTKANSTNRRGWSHYGLALAVLCLLSVQAVAQCTASPSCMNPKFNLSAYYGGQNITINQCIDPNSSSCAWADAAQAPINNPQQAEQYFLACSLTPNPIALCYYSGMPGLPDKTPSCTLSQNGNTAQCNCYEISANNPPDQTGEYAYSYVEITSILNQDVYNKTVSECGQGNINCLTLADVLNGTSKMQAPTLCAALTSQPNGLFPGADLVSDFSEIGMSTVNNPGIPPPLSLNDSEMCTTTYAACMTAPCKHTNKIDPATKLPLASCTCPTWDGPNQVGNPQILGPKGGKAYSCSPNPYVWSSAYLDLTK